MENLKLWLHSYYKHVHDNPDTLLPKFFGLYSIKAIGSARKVRFIVMANLFASNHEINRTFDLKGSMHGRFTKADDAKPNAVARRRQQRAAALLAGQPHQLWTSNARQHKAKPDKRECGKLDGYRED